MIKEQRNQGIQMDAHIRPACLPTKSTYYVPQKSCFVSGWGSQECEYLDSLTRI